MIWFWMLIAPFFGGFLIAFALFSVIGLWCLLLAGLWGAFCGIMSIKTAERIY